MRIKQSQKSEKQLDKIFEYIAQDSPFYTNSTVLEIIERAEVIEQPLQGRVVPEYKKEFIREVFVHPYRIIYELREKEVFCFNSNSRSENDAKEIMSKTKTKYIHSGNYVTEVEVILITTEDEWSPYLSQEEAKKLDNVREALNNNDFKKASEYGKVYKMEPVR